MRGLSRLGGAILSAFIMSALLVAGVAPAHADPRAGQAIGLAANAKAYPSTSVARLKSAFAATPSMPTVMAAPPTITKLADSAGPDFSPRQFVDLASSNVWTLIPPTVSFTGALNDGVTRNYYTTFPNSITFTPPEMAAFYFDGQILEVVTNRSGSLLLVVNGQLASSTQTVNSYTGNPRYIYKYDFGARGPKKIELYSGDTVAGFFIGASDSIWANDRSKELSIGFQDDSYGSSLGTIYTFGWNTALALGIKNVWTDVYGGTGYVATNGAGTDFLSRLNATTVPYAPDIYVVLGGINDSSAAAITTQLATYYSTLRAKWPNAVIVAVGPWCPNGAYATDGGQKYVGIRDAIKAAVAAVPGPWVFVDNLTGKWNNSSGASGGGASGDGAWQTGSGWNAASTGTATISIASPAVVTYTNNFVANQPVRFTTTGALPTGITAGTVYYVRATALTTSSFQISATSGGGAVNTSGSQSGVHTITGGTGSGNGDLYIDNGGVHPTVSGVDYLSQGRMAKAIREAVLGL